MHSQGFPLRNCKSMPAGSSKWKCRHKVADPSPGRPAGSQRGCIRAMTAAPSGTKAISAPQAFLAPSHYLQQLELIRLYTPCI